MPGGTRVARLPSVSKHTETPPRPQGRRDAGTGKKPNVLERLARAATHAAGGSAAFTLALGAVAVWLVTGPIFHYSDTWQLVINTATTIVTFLMVFLIQRSQNKDAEAMHLKLNELVAASKGASNRLIAIEELSEAELDTLRHYYAELVALARRDASLTQTHSIEEARRRHGAKGDVVPPRAAAREHV